MLSIVLTIVLVLLIQLNGVSLYIIPWIMNWQETVGFHRVCSAILYGRYLRKYGHILVAAAAPGIVGWVAC